MSSVVTRRRTVIGFSALSAAIVLPSRARADQAVLEAAARQEGTLTWYVAQQDTETAELFGRTFTALHPGVTVDVIRTTGQVAFQRLSLDIKNSYAALRCVQRHRHRAHAAPEGTLRSGAVHAGQQC